VEIDFGELPDDLIQKIGIGKSVNLVVESEFSKIFFVSSSYWLM